MASAMGTALGAHLQFTDIRRDRFDLIHLHLSLKGQDDLLRIPA